MKVISLMAYEMDDGKNYVGRPFTLDMLSKTCKLRDGCVIHKANLPADKDYEEGIKELYPGAGKTDVLKFSLEKLVKPHTISLTIA